MWKTTLFSLFKSLIYFQIHFVESWKMKVCLNGTIYEIGEYKCSHGTWFVEPKRISNICFERGMWAIYQDWCDQNPLIWTVNPGTTGCVGKDLLKGKTLGIFYLGKHEKGAIMSTSGRRLFFDNKDLKKEKKLEFVDSTNIEVLTWGSAAYTLEQKIHYKTEQKCLIKGKTSFYGYYKFDLQETFNVSIFLGEDLCKNREFKGTRVQVIPRAMEFRIHQSTNNSFSMDCKPYVPQPPPEIINEDSPQEDEDSSSIIEQKIDEQSQRIGLKLYAYHFSKDEYLPDFKFEFEEWQFLELSVTIFKKACPNGMVSEFYLDNIFTLFRFLIQESFNIFPPNVDKDDATRLRIWEALRQCDAKAKTMEFRNDEACSKETPLLRYQSNQGSTVLRMIELPRQIKINAEKFDLILESIWKLMIFIHYYCAESFNEYSSDLSVLQNRWQSLFAPDVIRRWKNPGRSYEMIQRIFMSINLTKTIKNIDFCVGASHMNSTYKGWLKRPLTKWDFRERNGSKADLIWDGHAYCVNDFAYPAVKLGYPIEKCGIRYS